MQIEVLFDWIPLFNVLSGYKAHLEFRSESRYRREFGSSTSQGPNLKIRQNPFYKCLDQGLNDLDASR